MGPDKRVGSFLSEVKTTEKKPSTMDALESFLTWTVIIPSEKREIFKNSN